MFSPIECSLKPSRLSPGLTFGPILLMGLFGWLAGAAWFWLVPTVAITLYVLWHTHRQESGPAYLRWQGDRLLVFDDADVKTAASYQWTGHGRRNALYLRLELVNEEFLRHDLVIWRDSVTEAGWRSLNAAYRVNGALFEARREQS